MNTLFPYTTLFRLFARGCNKFSSPGEAARGSGILGRLILE